MTFNCCPFQSITPTGPTSGAATQTGSPRALLAIVNLSPAPKEKERGREKKSRAQFATLGSDIDVSAPNYIVDSDDGGPFVRGRRRRRHGIKYSRTDFLLGENSTAGKEERN